MLHHRPRLAGTLTIVAALLLAPSALAKAPGATKAEQRAYGKYCKASGKAKARPGDRTKCLKAMAKLD
ncbi:MAG TPA: hypothetical protein VNT54_13000, partial [Solirubrobacteraceae bacterium]|nr:hypothetical protein [Solirubrobacteraceae bacterium]